MFLKNITHFIITTLFLNRFKFKILIVRFKFINVSIYFLLDLKYYQLTFW
jgi:hypothetical protein